MSKIFTGIRVIDFTNNIAGPLGPTLLADLGADVIKVERPKVGDDTRAWPPFVKDSESASFMWHNRGKRSITLALENPQAQIVARKLMEKADIIVESFKPGAMAKFGLDYPTVKAFNPRIIYCSVSAYGQTGPYSKKPGYDLMAQALSGLMEMTGRPELPPSRAGFALADYGGGAYNFASLCAALYHREKTGQGQYIDISLLDCMVVNNENFERVAVGEHITRMGNHHPMIAPFGFFTHHKSQRPVFIAGFVSRHWTILCDLIGKPEWATDESLNTNPKRVANVQLIIKATEDWLDSFDNIEKAMEILDKAGLANSKVSTLKEVLEDEHLAARGTVADFTLSTGEVIKARGFPFKFSETPATLGIAPKLGEHQNEVMQEIGYTSQEIEKFKQDGLF